MPAGVPPEAVVFAEPLACAAHCISRLAHITEHLSLDNGPVAIDGAGMAGTLMALQLEKLGVPVSIVNRTRGRSAFLAAGSVVRRSALSGIISDHSFQRVIVATANVEGWAFARAVSLVCADRGVVLIFGGTRPGVSFRGIDLAAVRRGERLTQVASQAGEYYLAGTYGANASDFAEALRLLEHGPRDSLAASVARLVVRRVPLLEAAPFLSQEAQAGRLIGKAVVEIDPASSGTRRT